MLNIKLGYTYDEQLDIYFSATDFYDNVVDENIVLTDFGRKVIKEIDKGEVIDKNVIVTEVLGGISQRDLSGGTKALLSLYSDQSNQIKLDICCMGDNCFPLLAKIADKKDITLYTEDYRDIFNNTGLKCVKILNTNKIINTAKEWYDAYYTWLLNYEKE